MQRKFGGVFGESAACADDDKRKKGRPPSREELARIAADRAMALAERPRLRVAPGRRGITGMASYFWLARPPQPITATASIPGLTVVAQARPVQYVWTFGDGTDTVTRSPGRPYRPRRPGTIRHTYETKARYRLLVEVIWEARWRIGPRTWRHLGYFSNSDSRRYLVREVVARLDDEP